MIVQGAMDEFTNLSVDLYLLFCGLLFGAGEQLSDDRNAGHAKQAIGRDGKKNKMPRNIIIIK